MAAFGQISGTIKSQGQLDGKFRANVADTSLKYLLILSAAHFMGMSWQALFGRDPQPQAKRDQGDRADPAEPKCGEPEQTLSKRTWIWLGWRQW
jgi:hypothetical protein